MSECSTDRLSLSLETLRGCIARMGQAGGPDGQPRPTPGGIGRKLKRAATERGSLAAQAPGACAYLINWTLPACWWCFGVTGPRSIAPGAGQCHRPPALQAAIGSVAAHERAAWKLVAFLAVIAVDVDVVDLEAPERWDVIPRVRSRPDISRGAVEEVRSRWLLLAGPVEQRDLDDVTVIGVDRVLDRGPPLPTPPVNVLIQVGNFSETMHGSRIASLNCPAHVPSVDCVGRGRVVEPPDRPGRPAADVIVLVLAQRHDRLVRGIVS